MLLLSYCTLLLVMESTVATATTDPYDDYEARLNQFVVESIANPVCDLYVELLRKANNKFI
jgi:hypothetical protein